MHQEGEQRKEQQGEDTEENRNFIGTKCEGNKYFRIKEKTIKYIGENWKATQLLSDFPVSSRNTASIKLVNVPNGYIGFGVIDSKFRGQRFTNWKQE